MPTRDSRLTEFAREMPKAPTRAEAILWWTIRNRSLGVKFRRQEPIGPYIADFACWSRRLVVEIDGPTYFEPGRQEYDRKRDDWFRSEGWPVLRTDDDEVWSNRDGVIELILRHLDGHPPDPASLRVGEFRFPLPKGEVGEADRRRRSAEVGEGEALADRALLDRFRLLCLL